MSTDPAPSYGVLGPLEVRRGGTALDLGPPKQRAVLACLLLARGRVVPVERLIEVVWGEDLPESALPSLQVYVSNLRRRLRDDTGASPIERRSPGYVLTRAGAALDADLFTDLAEEVRAALESEDWSSVISLSGRARDLWRGEVLADLGDAPWLVAERQTLHERLVDVGLAHVTALLARGEVEDAVDTARELAEQEPFRDDVARLLVLALHRAGRTPQALEAYARHAERLDDELGLEPSRGLRDTQVAVLRQEAWAASWPLPADASRVLPQVTPAGEPAAKDGFVGRSDQLEAAGLLTADVVSGASRCLVLNGPAGIGKTRLAEEVLTEVVRRGGRAVRTRSIEEAGAPAWWPLRQLVRELGADPDELLAVPADAGADTLRFVVYERLLRLLQEAAADRPLAVLVDDVQWLDATSAGCLVYLASALAASRVLVVATVRDGEGGTAVRQTVTGLLRAEGARQLVVPPLAEAEVAELAGRIGGVDLGDEEARFLARRTAGNALFVCEYARLPPRERAGHEVPLAVRGVLGRRVEALAEPVLDVLRVAAVTGDVVDLDLVAQVAGPSYDEVVDLLDDAAAAHIIEPVPGGSGYMFSHALLRDEVLAGLTPLRRQRLHARMGDALATAGRDRLTARAQHLAAAGPLVDPRELLEACRAAALQAEERMSSETAVGWWEQARGALARLPESEQQPQERDDLVVAQVEALVRAGRGQTVLDLLDAELVDAVRAGRTETAGRLAATLLRSAGTWPWVTFGADPGPVLERLRVVEPFVADDLAAHARVLAALGVGTCYDLDPSVPDELSRRGIERAEETGDPDVLADALLGRVITYVGEALHAAECEELLARLGSLPRRDQGPDAAVAHSAMTMSRLILGDIPGVERHLQLGIAASDLLRLRVVRAQLRWMEVGVAHWLRGPEAALQLHAAASAAHRATELYEGGFTNFNYMALRWDEGTLDRADDYEGFEQLTWSAAIAAARGRREEALALVEARLVEATPVAWSTLGHYVVLGHVVADLADDDLAPRMISVLTPYAGLLVSFGQGPVAGPVDYALARLHRLVGDDDSALASVRAARDLAARNQGRQWVERCQRLEAELGGQPG